MYNLLVELEELRFHRMAKRKLMSNLVAAYLKGSCTDRSKLFLAMTITIVIYGNSYFRIFVCAQLSIENTIRKMPLCVWQGLLSHRAISDPSTLILLSLPSSQGSVSSPSAHLAWLTKRLQRQFQCSCSSTCSWTEYTTSCSVHMPWLWPYTWMQSCCEYF